MAQFNNAYQSHQHSLSVLNLLQEHDTFMESINTVADMGAGGCLDTLWWAEATTRDDASEPLNLKCFAVDKKTQQTDFDLPSNIVYIQRDFEKACLPTPVDVIWCHDAFQYALNPLQTLKAFNQQMNVNGLLYIGIPLQNYHMYGRWQSTGENYQYHSHSFLSLLYSLAVNGFDCRDAYFRKAADDPWLHVAVFKSDQEPLDPATTSWFELAELGLLNDHVTNSIRTYGQVRQQDALFPWLDKALYRIEP
jgi:hypothetical protein